MWCYLPIALALLPLFISGQLVSLNDDARNAFLKAHNDARAKTGAKPLKWHRNAENVARNHISKCVFQHSTTAYGENLYATTVKPSNIPALAADAVEAWVDEQKYADPPVWSCMTGKCGHYTQVRGHLVSITDR
ncbi:uncharacterized protein LOC131956679 [Physella acuta]|uniref:uncharacterized protein LOC131956679 n=1 Tax=Physella acuta TaxID=109671 RepID=UPI0027DDA930|nr:uncharacterized protein LOC131956679 [Physella acuta]